ncbi:MAG: hypothetical protein CMK36_06950 [Porticoccaceae bacterium]|nr:hypothetical protein [Porticoccaceae bacterium]|tara:strand:- start:2252 stop:2785 length:534 start_codon:yes stop_codon:yes gene_type:complete
MAYSTDIVTFDSLQALFLDLNVDVTPSMFHGFVCGLLIRRGIDESQVFRKLEKWLLLSSEQRDILRECLYGYQDVVNNDLRDINYGFHPLLPSDHKPLNAKLNELANWCKHFLSGLTEIWDSQFETTEDTVEALKDLVEVTNVSLDTEVGGEGDFEYLLEHVRILVQVIYSDLHQSD